MQNAYRNRSTLTEFITYIINAVGNDVDQGSQTHLSIWAVVEDNSQSAGRTTKCNCFTQHCLMFSLQLKAKIQ